MLNKRIIFALLYCDGFFYLSRNFRLQKVGDINWLINNFGFGDTCHFIDELVCILVKKKPTQEDKKKFLENIEKLRKKIFIPITIGGGISSIDDVENYFLNGADKILINSKIYDSELMFKTAELWGEQSISIMIDYQAINNNEDYNIFTESGTKSLMTFSNFKDNILPKIPYGELILNSIDKDGNGTGLDLEIMKNFNNKIKSPILLMGGAGKPEHILEGLKIKNVSGVLTANLFNFLGSGLEIARKKSIDNGISLANFEKSIRL
jgi:imidazole glycerol-phosphate synthase subunit HisF|tara:strand:- start:246 stop:1040 length:795 start_codon:yes stop_codon:yes gene_type:complete